MLAVALAAELVIALDTKELEKGSVALELTEDNSVLEALGDGVGPAKVLGVGVGLAECDEDGRRSRSVATSMAPMVALATSTSLMSQE